MTTLGRGFLSILTIAGATFAQPIVKFDVQGGGKCGSLNPYALAQIYQPKAVLGQRVGDSDTKALPIPREEKVANFQVAKGVQAIAKIRYGASCDIPEASMVHGIMHMNFSSEPFGQCGGNNSGGIGRSDPHWSTRISLPGIPADRWDVTMNVTMHFRKERGVSCTAVIGDGQNVLKRKQLNVDGGADSISIDGRPPGQYDLSVKCVGREPFDKYPAGGCLGRGPNQPGDKMVEALNVTVLPSKAVVTPLPVRSSNQ